MPVKGSSFLSAQKGIAAAPSVLGEKIENRLAAEEGGGSYQHASRFLMRFVLLQSAVLALAAGVFVYILNTVSISDRYYAMSFDGSLVGMQAVPSPSLNVNSILRWTSDVAAEVMTFGFNDINTRIPAARPYFTEIGWEAFMAALRESYLISTLMNQQQLLTAVPAGTPVIEYEGLRNGLYVWDIRVPILLTLRAGGVSKTASPTLTVTVTKVPTRENPRGLAIQQWKML